MANSFTSTTGSNYQVYLSFREPDTGSRFTDFLYQKLIDAEIPVFRDDQGLLGERIDGSLEQAIDACKIYVPIFSRTYASSRQCLRELKRFMENTLKSEGNKEIVPIFFDVKPSDVKLETSLYNLDLEKMSNKEQLDAWKEVLTMVDPTKGWEVKNYER